MHLMRAHHILALLTGMVLGVINAGGALAQQVASLSPDLLSAYVASPEAASFSRDNLFQPETWVKPVLTEDVLSAYVADGYVSTAERVANMQDERTCLATAIYHEARGEAETGQLAVADVILNRVASSRYPSSICGVVYQNADRGKYRCQFSFACDGKPDGGGVGNRIVRESWVKAYMVAEAALKQREAGVSTDTIPDSALFYHTVSVSPDWADKLKRVASIGSHVFYAPL